MLGASIDILAVQETHHSADSSRDTSAAVFYGRSGQHGVGFKVRKDSQVLQCIVGSWADPVAQILWLHVRSPDGNAPDLYIASVYVPPTAYRGDATDVLDILARLDDRVCHYRSLGGHVIILGDFNVDLRPVPSVPPVSADHQHRAVLWQELLDELHLVPLNLRGPALLEPTRAERTVAGWSESWLDYILVEQQHSLLWSNVEFGHHVARTDHRLFYAAVQWRVPPPVAPPRSPVQRLRWRMENVSPKQLEHYAAEVTRQVQLLRRTWVIDAIVDQACLDACYSDMLHVLTKAADRVVRRVQPRSSGGFVRPRICRLLSDAEYLARYTDHQEAAGRLFSAIRIARARGRHRSAELQRLATRVSNDARALNAMVAERLAAVRVQRLSSDLRQNSDLRRRSRAVREILRRNKHAAYPPVLTVGSTSAANADDIRRLVAEHLCAVGRHNPLDATMGDVEFAAAVENDVERWFTAKDASSRPEFDADITKDELHSALQALRRAGPFKSPGLDSCWPWMLIHGGESVAAMLLTLFRAAWRLELVPSAWSAGVVIWLYKKGARDNLDNYRPITLLSVPGKLFTAVLLARLQPWVTARLAEEQCGFRPGRGCRDHVWTLQELTTLVGLQNKQQDDRQSRRQLRACFLDVRKAYDTAWQAGIWWLLRTDFQVDGKLWRMLIVWHANSVVRVDWDGGLSEPVPVSLGVRQGCLLAPLLYSVLINRLVEALRSAGGHGIDFRLPGVDVVVRCLMYADDVALLAFNDEDLQTLLQGVLQFWHKWRSRINAKKSEVVAMLVPPDNSAGVSRQLGRPGQPPNSWPLGQEVISRKDSFTYLGVLFHESGSFDPHGRAVYHRVLAQIPPLSNVRHFAGPALASDVWLCYLRPRLEFLSEAWGPRLTGGVRGLLEALQWRAARRVLDLPARTNNVVLAVETGWSSMWGRFALLAITWLVHVLGRAPPRSPTASRLRPPPVTDSRLIRKVFDAATLPPLPQKPWQKRMCHVFRPGEDWPLFCGTCRRLITDHQPTAVPEQHQHLFAQAHAGVITRSWWDLSHSPWTRSIVEIAKELGLGDWVNPLGPQLASDWRLVLRAAIRARDARVIQMQLQNSQFHLTLYRLVVRGSGEFFRWRTLVGGMGVSDQRLLWWIQLRCGQLDGYGINAAQSGAGPGRCLACNAAIETPEHFLLGAGCDVDWRNPWHRHRWYLATWFGRHVSSAAGTSAFRAYSGLSLRDRLLVSLGRALPHVKDDRLAPAWAASIGLWEAFWAFRS